MSANILKALGLTETHSGTYLGHGEWSKTTDAGVLESRNPATGELLGRVYASSEADYETIVSRAQEAFAIWRTTPAPRRGEAVRLCGEALRKHKDALGSLVTLEMGKIKPEGDGEVQEMIDIADFAVGQSRMLYGNSMHSERPGHRIRTLRTDLRQRLLHRQRRAGVLRHGVRKYFGIRTIDGIDVSFTDGCGPGFDGGNRLG